MKPLTSVGMSEMGTAMGASVDGVAGSPQEPEQLSLAAGFSAERADWQRLVAAVLRKTGVAMGGDTAEETAGDTADGTSAPEDLLTSETYDGITIKPLYTAEDTTPDTGFPGLPPFVRGATPTGALETGWDIRALHAHPDPAITNELLLSDLEGGVSSIWLKVGCDGIPVTALSAALQGVFLDLAPITLDAGEDYLPAAEALLELFAERGISDDAVVGTLGADPFGVALRTGQPQDQAPAVALAVRVARRYPKVRTIVVDGLPFHQAGGSDAQELGAAIASGVAYLRALTAAELSVREAASQLEFRLAATADQFLTIAKFRAARRVWDRVLEVSGVEAADRGMRQHAVTSPAMTTQRDPWANIMRATIACFSAGIGGAQAITVLPFDHALGLPDELSRRLARNTQAVLLEESKIADVMDPAGGSWYVENLTDQLAQTTWREFTEIERAGGIQSVMDSGSLAEKLAVTKEKRAQRITTRKEAIIGVNEFPNLMEKSLIRQSSARSPNSESSGLPQIRYAQDFEEWRDKSDVYLAESGRRPQVFLAPLGSLAAHTARVDFATNLFQAGGVETVYPGTTPNLEELVEAYRQSGTPIVCLCGSDDAYGEQANTLAVALRSAGAEVVFLAGKPSADYTEVTEFIRLGTNVLHILDLTFKTWGVPR